MTFVNPSVSQYFPGEQSIHSDSADLPVSGRNVPLGHGTGSPVPVGQ